ncbi:MAG: hypothetical protein ACOYIH_08880 [Candidatus Fimadaptatus sp.]|jgi:hypothetical protein
MATKNISSPKVTHTEILCLAIAQLNSQINEYAQKAAGFPADHPITQMMDEAAKPLKEKRAVIKRLYSIETGVEYNG